MPPANPPGAPDAAYLDLFKDVLTGAVYDESAWTLLHQELRGHPSGRFWSDWRRRFRGGAVGLLARFLGRYRIVMARVRPFDPAARAAGRDWPMVGYTMVGRRRLDHLQACVEQALAEGIPGDFMETGVWRGGAVMLIQAVLRVRGAPERLVWAADSFAGLPPPRSAADGWDLSRASYLAADRATVERNFTRFGLRGDNLRFLEGWFCDTLPVAPVGPLALLRLDGDLHSSTLDALTHLYPKVSRGGFVIVDDYQTWPGCRRAVDDYLAARGEEPAILRVDEDAVYWRV